MDAMAASAKDMNSKDNGEETKKNTSMTVRKSRRLQGMKMRDEFLCPITYELLREPVVALDGHTYEKSAIEKWLKSNHTSPRSGEIMEDSIISNTNLKKLIQDMINEGGAGLYTNDVCDSERLFDVFAEKVLILKCVGPPESDWNMQSFQVRSRSSEFSFLRLVCFRIMFILLNFMNYVSGSLNLRSESGVDKKARLDAYFCILTAAIFYSDLSRLFVDPPLCLLGALNKSNCTDTT
jgi:U-box domain